MERNHATPLARYKARLTDLRRAYAVASRELSQTASDKKRGKLHRQLDEIEAKLALYDGLTAGYVDATQTRARLEYLYSSTMRRIQRLHPRNYSIAVFYLARLHEIEAELTLLSGKG